MLIQTFEDVQAWQKGRQLTLLLYKLFLNSKDYSFKDQILRAVISILNNISEGFERKSRKELKQFLVIAKGSCGEVRSMLHIAHDLNYITKKEYEECHSLAIEISKMLGAFIAKI